MSIVVLDERPTWQEVVLSFAPPAKRTDRAAALLARLPIWLILIGQAILTWRLSAPMRWIGRLRERFRTTNFRFPSRDF